MRVTGGSLRHTVGWPFRRYLVLLIAMIAIPLFASVAYRFHLLADVQERAAADTALHLAESAAAGVRSLLEDTQRTAALLASRPQIRSLEPAACNGLLRELHPLLPLRANASVLDRDMRFVCSARPVPAGSPRPLRHEAFERALKGEASLSEPVRGLLSKRWIVAAAHPLRDAAGRVVSVVTVTIDISRLDSFLDMRGAPRGTIATVVMEDGTVVARSVADEQWIGRKWQGFHLPRASRAADGTTWSATDSDGGRHIYGAAPVNQQGWQLVVSVPAEALLAEANAQLRAQFWVAAALLAVLAAAIALAARRLTGPVQNMAEALRKGDARDLPVRGPRELAELARAFNASLAAERQTAQRLRESAARFDTLFEQPVFGITETDLATTRFLAVNQRFAQLLGYSREELLELDVRGITHPQDFPENLAHIARQRSGEQRAFSMDKRYVRKDGSILWAHLSSAVLDGPDGRPARQLSVIHDLTGRKLAEDALRAYAEEMRLLSARLGEVEEKERRAIHRELHDQIGANLSALKFELGAIAISLLPDAREALAGRLRGVQQLIKETVARTRDVMADLRPPALDDYGLLAALRNSAEAFAARTQLPVQVDGVDPAPRPAPVVETALFRIAQEALLNAAKHARASRLRVHLQADGARLVLAVEDDGVGFDAGPGLSADGHWGLRTMRERAQAIGAQLRIESSPGAGTRVVAEWRQEAA